MEGYCLLFDLIQTNLAPLHVTILLSFVVQIHCRSSTKRTPFHDWWVLQL